MRLRFNLLVVFVALALGQCFAGGRLIEKPLRVQNVEGELFAGVTAPLGLNGGKSAAGFGLGIEVRRNFKSTGWDVGGQISMMSAEHRYHNPHFADDPERRDHYYGQSNMTFSFMAVGDYNFRQGRRVNPFAGAGFGFAERHSDKALGPGPEGIGIAFMPRIGVELWSHLRVSASFYVAGKGNNCFALTIGGVIGGRKK